MKEVRCFRCHRIAPSLRPETEPLPRRCAPSPAGRLSRQGAAPILTAATGIRAAFGARDPCNRRVRDHIRGPRYACSWVRP